MTRLEDLKYNAAVPGSLPDALVSVGNVQWLGTAALELNYKDHSGSTKGEARTG